MSVPRTLSHVGLLVALACTLAACGSKKEAAAPTTPSDIPAAGNALQKINPTAHDPLACEFISAKQVGKVIPWVASSNGQEAACTFLNAKKQSPDPTLTFLYLSSSAIKQNIAVGGGNPKATIAEAWDTQKKAAMKEAHYLKVPKVGDSSYGQSFDNQLDLRWFIKDHVFYLQYNFDSGTPAQKKLVTMKQLIRVAKMVADPSTLAHS